MSKEDVDAVKYHLREAADRSKPLKDKDLTRKIEEATKHVERKSDTRTS